MRLHSLHLSSSVHNTNSTLALVTSLFALPLLLLLLALLQLLFFSLHLLHLLLKGWLLSLLLFLSEQSLTLWPLFCQWKHVPLNSTLLRTTSLPLPLLLCIPSFLYFPGWEMQSCWNIVIKWVLYFRFYCLWPLFRYYLGFSGRSLCFSQILWKSAKLFKT